MKHRKKIYNKYIHTRLPGLRRYGHSGRYILSTMYILMLAEHPPQPYSPHTSPFHMIPTYVYRYKSLVIQGGDEINEPQYFITYVRNEYCAKIRFSDNAYILPADPLFRYLLNNNFFGFVPKPET